MRFLLTPKSMEDPRGSPSNFEGSTHFNGGSYNEYECKFCVNYLSTPIVNIESMCRGEQTNFLVVYLRRSVYFW
jgi:hypothetical protein